MFTIADGRDRLYQWDSDVKLIIDKEIAPSIDEAHFTAKYSRECLTVKVVHTDTESYVMVPNILLQKSYDIIVYAFCCTDKATKYIQEIQVIAKPKPADYVYTETEVYSIKIVVDNALEDAKNSGLFDGEDGFSPVVEVQDIAGGHRVTITDKNEIKTFDVLDGLDGNDGNDGITPHIGDNGNWWIGNTDTGKPSRGGDGHTPVKGEDYYTAEEKEELVEEISENLNLTGGGADWNAAEGEPGYVQNRTHWVEKSEFTELPIIGEWNIDNENGVSGLSVVSPIGLAVDNTYTVKYNGTDYTVKAIDLSLISGGETGGVFLGNLAIMGGEDTGEPFMIMEASEETDGLYGMIYVVGAVESFAIYGEGETVTKLPAKFLDDKWIRALVRGDIQTSADNTYQTIMSHVETVTTIPTIDLTGVAGAYVGKPVTAIIDKDTYFKMLNKEFVLKIMTDQTNYPLTVLVRPTIDIYSFIATFTYYAYENDAWRLIVVVLRGGSVNENYTLAISAQATDIIVPNLY